jgi:CheY-like chemotaxis protein/predicted Ser/Thr protein kinase
MARVTIISNDLDIRLDTLSALEGVHDVAVLGWPLTQAPPEQLTAHRPDVIMVDLAVLSAPGGSDLLDAATLVSDSPGARRAPPAVLVLLAEGQEGQIVPCFEAGADDYLTVPFNARHLRAKVDGLQAVRLGLLGTSAHDPIAISDEGMILASPDLESGAGTQLGRYRICGLLGRGGYGVVYRAWDVALEREVALKVLPKDMHDDTEAVARFFREASAITRLNHPNIVKLYEVGNYQGRYYLTMELLEGRTLKDLAEREAPLDARRAARYVGEIAKALGAINSIGLVHRDIKPENVMITRDEEVKLIDFGLVRIRDTAAITSEEDVLGTPYFMCPEYIREPGVPDIRYDLYALGVTFFNLLSGEYPFDGKNAAHVMEKHLRVPAPRVSSYQPGVPYVADRVIDRLLRKDPNKRPQTPEEVLLLLQPLLRRAYAA